MPTTHPIILPVTGGFPPDGSGSGNNPATPEPMISGGTQTSNSAKASNIWLLFDASTDEHWLWTFELPSDYVSGGTLAVIFSTKGTSTNAVVWKGAAAIGVVGTTDWDQIVFDTVVTASGTPSATQGVTTRTTMTLTMTNAAANRPITIMVGRDADNGSDTNANDACLIACTFEYVGA